MTNKINRSTRLAAQQNVLLNAIFTTNIIASQAINTLATPINSLKIRGLQAYQANASALAVRSLHSTYPVVAQLIGEQAFEHLARDLWSHHPPQRGDMAQWGGDMPAFITSIAALQTEPYLSDVAKAEWALHKAATAADKTADLATFALLTEHDPDTVTLQLAPGTALIHSNYPVASILTAHLYDSPSFEDVGQKLRQNTPEIALVWRQGFRPSVSNCAAGEAAFLRQLLTGKSLLAALETPYADDSTHVDFNTWLPQAVQSGLLLGAYLL